VGNCETNVLSLISSFLNTIYQIKNEHATIVPKSKFLRLNTPSEGEGRTYRQSQSDGMTGEENKRRPDVRAEARTAHGHMAASRLGRGPRDVDLRRGWWATKENPSFSRVCVVFKLCVGRVYLWIGHHVGLSAVSRKYSTTN